MIAWAKYPFIRLLVPFIIGIYLAFSLADAMSERKSILILLISIFLLLSLLIVTSVLIGNYRFRWMFSVLLFSFVAISGFTLVMVRDYKLILNDISKINPAPEYFLARLYECPFVKEKTIKVMLEVFAYEDDGRVKDIDSKIIAYFEKEDKSLNLKYGDCIIILKNPEEVEKPPNPEQFDYKDYLYKKGVTHQVYLKSDLWINLNYNDAVPVYRFSYWIRDFLLSTMRCLGVKDNEYAVASAILLGYDDTLPQDLRQKYVAAGAMHVLCVSGLHVSVIFMVFSYMLIFLNDRKKCQRIVKQLVLLVLVWFYALIAGLAPSVLRATIMISFMIIGNIINRKGVLLNSLAASAFILLCVDPATLFDIGFLLSYVAVVGIVVLQKPIYKMFYFKCSVLNKIWEMTSVTIAAQIATTPFTIYYFHQFPIYFWLSNLFMTPVSSIVIIGGMIMLLLFFVPYVNNMIAFMVSRMIFVMNYGASWIESLPCSIVKGLYVNEIQFVILLLMLLAALLLVGLRTKKMLFLLLTSSCLFLVINLNNLTKWHEQKEMVVYSINNMTAMDFISGKKHVLVADSAFCHDESAFSYNVENFLVSRGVYHGGKTVPLNEEFDEDFVKKRKNILTFDGKLVGLTDGGECPEKELGYRMPLDYMVVYGKKRLNLKSLLNIYDFDNLVICGNVPYYWAARLLEEADDLGIRCFDIRRDGAVSIK